MIRLRRPFRFQPAGIVLGPLLIVLLATAPSPAETGAIVEFVSPRHLSTAIGPSELELRIMPPPGITIERVELFVDGSPLTTLTGPPWGATWDAGDGSKGHGIEAIVRLSDGTSHRGAVRTSPLRINYVEEVGLVNLYPVVRSAGGDYVADLTQEDFTVLEDGKEQAILRFSTERRPLRIGIVLDTSLSMEGKKLQNARKAALEFLDILEPGDEGMVVTFSDRVQIMQEITSDRKLMAEAIESVEALGGTALYDAIWRTSLKLSEFDGRRVLVLLSDGRDGASNGFEPGSLHTMEEALHQALLDEVMIFAIGLGKNLDTDKDFHRRYTVGEILQRLADETGGRFLLTPNAGRLRRSFNDVAEDLRHQYSIAYRSDEDDRDGGWRSLQLLTPGRDLDVTCRKGYFASSP